MSNIAIDENAVEEHFVRATGPGGQNVNKVATSVQLRYAIDRARGLDRGSRRRLKLLAGKRVNREGVLVITAHRLRSQERNRQDARARLLDLLLAAAVPPRPRFATRPTRSSREDRLKSKHARSRVKRLRQARPKSEDE
jgi:ribosome-associated protein